LLDTSELGTHLIRAQHRAGQRADPPASATAIAISEVAAPHRRLNDRQLDLEEI